MKRLASALVLALFLLMETALAFSSCFDDRNEFLRRERATRLASLCISLAAVSHTFSERRRILRKLPLEFREQKKADGGSSGEPFDRIGNLETLTTRITIEDMRREILKIYRRYLARDMKPVIRSNTVHFQRDSPVFGEGLVCFFLEVYGMLLNFIYFAQP